MISETSSAHEIEEGMYIVKKPCTNKIWKIETLRSKIIVECEVD